MGFIHDSKWTEIQACQSCTHISVVKAEHLTNYDKFYLRYIRFFIEGMEEERVPNYIRGFFADSPESANSLIELVENDCTVEEYLRCPLFCSMVCHMWKDRSRYFASKKLQTISQIVQEMVFALIEQCIAKLHGEEAIEFKAKCDDCFRKLGQVAYVGMLRRQWTFRDIEFTECMDAVKTGCLIGVVNTWTRVGPIEFRRREGRQTITDVRFPHRLLQEYVASEYLASIHQEDKVEFEKLMKGKVLVDCKEYKNFLYLLVAHNAEVGRDVMEMLCTTIKNEQLVMDVAFECQDREVITPAVELMKQTTSISIQAQNMFRHTWNGYLDTWETFGLQIVSKHK